MKPTSESKPQILAETHYLQLVQDGHWTYARRPNSIGAVGIVAVTDDQHLVLVEQHRIPVGGIEFSRTESSLLTQNRSVLNRIEFFRIPAYVNRRGCDNHTRRPHYSMRAMCGR